jgi:hypothetical protein
VNHHCGSFLQTYRSSGAFTNPNPAIFYKGGAPLELDKGCHRALRHKAISHQFFSTLSHPEKK